MSDENKRMSDGGPSEAHNSFEAQFRSFRRDLPSAVTGDPDPDGWASAARHMDLLMKERARAEKAEAERDAGVPGFLPLVWVEQEDEPSCAEALVGHYVTFPQIGRCELIVGHGSSFSMICWRHDLNRKGTEAELRAAAQADHEERIRKAVTKPVP